MYHPQGVGPHHNNQLVAVKTERLDAFPHIISQLFGLLYTANTHF